MKRSNKYPEIPAKRRISIPKKPLEKFSGPINEAYAINDIKRAISIISMNTLVDNTETYTPVKSNLIDISYQFV